MTHGHVRRIGAVVALLLASLVAIVALPGTAHAAPCDLTGNYAGSATITVQPAGPVSPGQEITVIGEGFPPNCEVDITVNGVVVGTVTTSPTGTFTFGYTLGSNISGTVTIGAVAGGFVREVTLPVMTSGATTTVPAAGPLPRTGSDTDWMVGAGIGLLAVGGLLLLATRKRHAATPAA